ncbi:MAG: hypothetical protein QXF01_01430, partial [Candidatus Micrarchaeaceae archaeon]
MRTKRLYIALVAAFFMLPLLGSASAYYNLTAINTTVLLNSSTGAHVTETYSIFISNSSISQYEASRGAYNLSISDWQRILGTPLLTEHIINPRAGVENITLLPVAPVLTSQGAAAK